MFNNQKIRFRILLGYSVPLILLLIVALAVNFSLRSYARVHEDTARGAKIVALANEISLYVTKMQRSARGALLVKGNTQSIEHYEEHKKNLERSIQAIAPLIKDEKQKVLLDELVSKVGKTRDLADKLIDLVAKGDHGKAAEMFRSSAALNMERESEALADEFEKYEESLLVTWTLAEERALENVARFLLAGIFLAFLTSIVTGLLVSRGITNHISSAINTMSSTSTEIAATVTQHERNASQQASMVNETTTTIQELGASSRQTAEQASSAAEAAQSALKATSEGVVMVTKAIEGMNSLNDKVGKIAEQTLKLGEQTAQVGSLANMVKDLSGEINMLALNAAVEAARAGEHGKGFAVVAGEVRKLANESKKSAEQANAVIADIQKATNATILRTEEGTKVVEEVTGYTRNVGELFESLSDTSNKVYENAQQVMLNAKQQSTAINQIVEAMNVLNVGARETAAGIVQTKTGIDQLNNAAVNLKQIV